MNIEELFTQIMMRFDKIDNTLDRMTRVKDGLDGDSLLDNYDMCMLLNINKGHLPDIASESWSVIIKSRERCIIKLRKYMNG